MKDYLSSYQKDRSLWERRNWPTHFDVIIVGGGFTGLYAALELKNHSADLRIAVLDASIRFGGASTRNAGFVCFGSPTEILADFESMGEKKAVELIAQRIEGIEYIKRRFPAETIELEWNGGTEIISGDNTTVDEERIEMINDLIQEGSGISKAFTLKKGIKFGLKKDIVVCHTRHEGSMDPVKAVIHLEKECEEKGVEIIQGCHVRQIMDDDNPVHLKTTLGTFSATRVALCTNALSRDLYPGLDVRPAKNQVYVTSRIRHSLIGTYHMDKGFVYFRPVGDRVLIGGGRHLHRKNEEGVSFDHRIEDFLKETLGSYLETDDEIRFEYKWIGHIGIGQSKEPLVSSNLNGVIHGVRLSGMGVALAPVLAKKIVNLILDNLDA